ncbi:MAG: hypothetical protein ACFNKL_02075 [Treponema sp.]
MPTKKSTLGITQMLKQYRDFLRISQYSLNNIMYNPKMSEKLWKPL